jgi:malic enzyme
MLTCRLFPPFQQIRSVSAVLAARVAEHMASAGLSTVQLPAGESWQAYVERHMWRPELLPAQQLQPAGKL